MWQMSLTAEWHSCSKPLHMTTVRPLCLDSDELSSALLTGNRGNFLVEMNFRGDSRVDRVVECRDLPLGAIDFTFT